MYQKLDFAIGFFIAIACLSSVLLALTFIYVSRLKPRTISNHATVPVTTPASGPAELSESPEQSSLTQIEDPAMDIRTKMDPPNPTTSTPSPSKLTGPDDAAVVDRPKTTVAEARDNERAGSNSGDPSQGDAPPELALSMGVRTEIPSLGTKQLSAVETAIARVPPAEIAPIPDSQKEEMSISLTGTEAKQAADAAGLGASSSPLITVVNNREVNDTMADKPTGDQPRDAKQDTSFADLFTEDTEETEATKLGKELSDVDAGDILKMTQNLADQLKVRRPANK